MGEVPLQQRPGQKAFCGFQCINRYANVLSSICQVPQQERPKMSALFSATLHDCAVGAYYQRLADPIQPVETPAHTVKPDNSGLGP